MLRVRRFLGVSLFLGLAVILSGCGSSSSNDQQSQAGFVVGEGKLGEIQLGAVTVGNSTAAKAGTPSGGPSSNQ